MLCSPFSPRADLSCEALAQEDDVRERLTARGRDGALPNGAELVISGRFAASRPSCPRLDCVRSAVEAGLDMPGLFRWIFCMKVLLQTGSSGGVPVPSEKRFLININCHTNREDQP